MKRLIENFAAKFGINEEDVRELFEYFVHEHYDGHASAFLDDMELGFITTEAGRVLLSECVDDAIETISAREPY